MDPRFESIHSHPANDIFSVVFFPDRIYHAQYLNATRSTRYRYNVHEVRGKADITALKGQVYLDGERISSFLRLEYRASRLVEQARERGRFVRRGVIGWVGLETDAGAVDARVRLEHCPWIDAHQVEIWETLEPPPGRRHDFKVAQMMGRDGSITHVPELSRALAEPKSVRRVQVAFREDAATFPSGWGIGDGETVWDNFYSRNVQMPNTQNPSDSSNTVRADNYLLDFQRAYFFPDVRQLAPVRYRNAMMADDHPDSDPNNIIEMRWVLQRELGGSLVFFHEVTIPPGKVEGTHQHIGSEELYYIVSGEGVAYLGENDDPKTSDYPVVDQDIFGLEVKGCREVPVKPGAAILTKSGGIHGIRNAGAEPLKFVAFLYHSS